MHEHHLCHLCLIQIGHHEDIARAGHRMRRLRLETAHHISNDFSGPSFFEIYAISYFGTDLQAAQRGRDAGDEIAEQHPYEHR
jgi:hypothetical protein